MLFLKKLAIVVGIITCIAAAPVSVDEKAVSNDTKAGVPEGKSASAASASSSGCFSSDTLVTLANRKRIPIGQIQPGHRLLTVDGTTVFTTEMMMMLHQNKLSSTMFHTILTTSGHKLSLTKFHLLSTLTNNGDIIYKFAQEIERGDVLRVVTNDHVHTSVVKNITMEIKTGYYAPLTLSGTLLVNDIVASCFANIENHEMVQFYLNPLRWYYRFSRLMSVEKPFGDAKENDIHYVPQMLYELVQSVYPSLLRF